MTPAAVLLRRTLGPLLLVAVIAGVVAGIVSGRQRPGVEAALTLTVPSPARQRSGNASPGGNAEDTAFEALQSAELFSETLTGWLTSPDFVARVYARAHVAFPRPTTRRLSRAFTAVKRGGPVVDVRFRSRSKEEAGSIVRSLVDELRERRETFNAATGGQRFQTTASDPLIIPVQTSPPLRGVVAGVVAFALGLNLVLLWDFLRPESELKKQ